MQRGFPPPHAPDIDVHPTEGLGYLLDWFEGAAGTTHLHHLDGFSRSYAPRKISHGSGWYVPLFVKEGHSPFGITIIYTSMSSIYVYVLHACHIYQHWDGCKEV